MFSPNIPAELFHICRLHRKVIFHSGVYIKKMSTPKGDSRLVEKTKAVYVTVFTVPASNRQAAVLFDTC